MKKLRLFIGRWAMSLFRKAVRNWDYNLNSILDSTYNGLVATDNNGCIVLLNEAARNLLNLREEPVGMLIQEILPDSYIFEVLRTGKAEIGRKVVINNHLFLINISPILKEREVLGTVVVFEDVAPVTKVSSVNLKTRHSNSLKSILEETEINVLKETLENTGGNKVKAAKILGISRAGLYQKLEKYNLLTGK